jgi:membrane protease YdiL (CAAX protease family)
MMRKDGTAAVCLSAAIVIIPLVAANWVLRETALLTRQAVLGIWGVGATLICQRLLFSDTWQTAWRAIGFVGAPGRIILASVVAAAPMWILLPVLCWMNGISIAIHPEWASVLLGVILVNGITEEVIHRGYVFRRARRTQSFSRAAAISAAVFAAQHVYLIVTMGWIAGISSVVLAALLAFPLAYVFERGGNSIVAPAILHTSSNAPMLILYAPDGRLTSVLVPYMACVLGSIYLVFVLRRLLRA